MKVRHHTVPFSKVVGPDAHELEFGPDDYLVVRPLFALSTNEVEAWTSRIRGVGDIAAEAEKSGDKKKIAEAEKTSTQLILDVIHETCKEWHLEGDEGPIPMPGTPEALNALPHVLRASLFGFLTTYRGEGPNPTTRG